MTRVFKLVRRCEALLVLVRALSRTRKELLLLAGMVSISALLLGSVMYYVEYSHVSSFSAFVTTKIVLKKNIVHRNNMIQYSIL